MTVTSVVASVFMVLTVCWLLCGLGQWHQMLVLLDPQISCLWGFSFPWEVPEDSAVLSERSLLARWPCSVPPYHPGLGTEGPSPLCVCSQAVPAFVLSTGAYVDVDKCWLELGPQAV